MKKSVLVLIFLMIGMIPLVSAQENYVCSVYFTKIGCTVCAQTDPVIFGEWINKYGNLVVIEYLINEYENSLLMGKYNIEYGTGGGVPLLIFDKEDYMSGIYYPQYGGLNKWKKDMEDKIEGFESNNCLLLNSSESFGEIDLNKLPGRPKIWSNGRILIREGEGLKDYPESSDFLKNLIFSDNPEESLETLDFKITEIEAEPVSISYGEIYFKKSFRIEPLDSVEGNENYWIINYESYSLDESPQNTGPKIKVYVGIILLVVLSLSLGRWVVMKRKGKK